MGEVLAGIDVGGTKTQAIICTPDYRILRQGSVGTPAKEGGSSMVSAAIALVERLLEDTDASLRGVGVGAAGMVDPSKGMVTVASNSFRGWAGFPVTKVIADHFGVPCAIDNDVNAFVRGEVTTGDARGRSNVLAIMLGTGVGGALWMDDAVFQGETGAAGEIGHISGFGNAPCTCGGHGHLETVASGNAIARRYSEISSACVGSARDVADLARGGNAHAKLIFEEAGRAIAQAMSMEAGLLDITTFVLGGGVCRSWDLLEGSVRRELSVNPPLGNRHLDIFPCADNVAAVSIGAATLLAV
ncbi:MAG: ROK family protein [Bifidobacterium sp.]|uniref:ROK family protein n=1 Tax=Bifidobacterium sp. TaxID=41200 RepID=UPI0039EB826E